MTAPAPWDLAPLATLLGLGALLAAAPLALAWRRHRGRPGGAMLRALTLMTLFLTFDLVVFGAFTRLTDSGLGCPDWPGCYGHASPLGAHAAIGAAQDALPAGPVTHGKAWIEMVHRYLATGVGALITLLMAWHWVGRVRRGGRAGFRPGWATVTFAWVCVQGAFGALTVTMKLYPAIVTLHLLGGIGLLALLAVQAQLPERPSLPLARGTRAGVVVVLGLTVLQVALGGWVSTNYAVLACSDFPTCQGQWWPPADFESGFTLLRGLGQAADGGWLPFAALTAIHLTHRIGAAVLVVAMALLAWRLAASRETEARRWAGVLVGVTAWQVASGLGNVLLGWPLAAAVAHTAGAAALVAVLASMLARSRATAGRAVVAATRRQGLPAGGGAPVARAS